MTDDVIAEAHQEMLAAARAGSARGVDRAVAKLQAEVDRLLVIRRAHAWADALTFFLRRRRP